MIPELNKGDISKEHVVSLQTNLFTFVSSWILFFVDKGFLSAGVE
jgi:hypothetical protein